MNYNLKYLVLILFILASCKNDHSPSKAIKRPTAEIDNTPPSQSDNRPKDKRMSWQKPEEVIQSLGNIEDKVIADIGAGIGYFSFKLLPKSKKVISIDIDPESTQILEAFKSTLRDDLMERFDVRLATPTDPQLKEEEVDILFIVNTIAYLTPRVAYLKNIKKALKDGGKIFIVDFKTKQMPDFVNAPAYDQRLYLHVVEEQLEAAGYTNITTDDTSLEYQYMVTASK